MNADNVIAFPGMPVRPLPVDPTRDDMLRTLVRARVLIEHAAREPEDARDALKRAGLAVDQAMRTLNALEVAP